MEIGAQTSHLNRLRPIYFLSIYKKLIEIWLDHRHSLSTIPFSSQDIQKSRVGRRSHQLCPAQGSPFWSRYICISLESGCIFSPTNS